MFSVASLDVLQEWVEEICSKIPNKYDNIFLNFLFVVKCMLFFFSLFSGKEKPSYQHLQVLVFDFTNMSEIH